MRADNHEKLVEALRIMYEESVKSAERLSNEEKQITKEELERSRMRFIASKSSRPLRNEVKSTLKELQFSVSPDVRSKILEMIKDQTGLTYRDLDGDSAAAIEKILARGEVKSVAEFRALRHYLDEMEGLGNTEAANRAIELLDKFELRKGRG